MVAIPCTPYMRADYLMFLCAYVTDNTTDNIHIFAIHQ